MLIVGAVATNVIGKRLLQQTRAMLLRVPLFRTIYAPVKQLVVAFSPDNESGSSGSCWSRILARLRARVPHEGVHRRSRPGAGGADRRLRADQPSLSGRHRHLPARRVSFPDITVEQGIRMFLTGGMALARRGIARAIAAIELEPPVDYPRVSIRVCSVVRRAEGRSS